MQSLLFAEDLHHGQFVQQGFKYENVPVRLLSVRSGTAEISEVLAGADVVFLLVQNLETADRMLTELVLHGRSVPVILLVQQYDSKLAEYVKNGKIHDFHIRPFSFRFIANETRSLVYRQREQSSYQILRVRDLELNRDTHEVRWKGQAIQLRHKEFILLEFLMLNAGRLLSRETILESVWDRNANIFTNTVDVHINKLRKKIDYNVSEKFIHTVHCSGYIFS